MDMAKMMMGMKLNPIMTNTKLLTPVSKSVRIKYKQEKHFQNLKIQNPALDNKYLRPNKILDWKPFGGLPAD